MSTRRNIAPRKRSTAVSTMDVHTSRPQSKDVGSSASSPLRQSADASTEAALDAGIRELLESFQDVLAQDQNLDAQTRDTMMEQLVQAMHEAKVANGPMTIPTSEDWSQAVLGLQQSGELDQTDAEELLGKLNNALKPLERRETKLALEFSKRLVEHGEAEALAWLRAETAKIEAREAKAPVGAAVAQSTDRPLRSETVKSRSRKLRGPPET